MCKIYRYLNIFDLIKLILMYIVSAWVGDVKKSHQDDWKIRVHKVWWTKMIRCVCQTIKCSCGDTGTCEYWRRCVLIMSLQGTSQLIVTVQPKLNLIFRQLFTSLKMLKWINTCTTHLQINTTHRRLIFRN